MSNLILPANVREMQHTMGRWLNEAVDNGSTPALMISVKKDAIGAVVKLHLVAEVSKEQVTDFLRGLLSSLDQQPAGIIIEP
jgi:hypothetical protein